MFLTCFYVSPVMYAVVGTRWKQSGRIKLEVGAILGQAFTSSVGTGIQLVLLLLQPAVWPEVEVGAG